MEFKYGFMAVYREEDELAMVFKTDLKSVSETDWFKTDWFGTILLGQIWFSKEILRNSIFEHIIYKS